MLPAPCQLASGATDHTTDRPVSAVRASNRPRGQRPRRRVPAGASTMPPATIAPQASVRVSSSVVIGARLSPPPARNVAKHRTPATASVAAVVVPGLGGRVTGIAGSIAGSSVTSTGVYSAVTACADTLAHLPDYEHESAGEQAR